MISPEVALNVACFVFGFTIAIVIATVFMSRMR